MFVSNSNYNQHKKNKEDTFCYILELNQLHSNYQFDALPSELMLNVL